LSGEPKAVRVWLLGEFKVSVESRLIEEDDWRLRKAAALLKLLALSPQYRLHREQVINLLWPDLDERAAVNNLHHALHIARRTLGPASDTSSCYLRLRNGQLELCREGPLWVDVEAFEEAAATARRVREPAAYLAALDLYGGDLLPGDRYEEWAEDRREELRRTYLSLLVELAGLYEERKEFGAAIEALRRAITEEPAHEEAHVGLMRLYALSGRRAEALKQYKRLEEILSRKFATEPEATSSQLHEEISASRFPPAESTSPASLPAKGAPSASWHNLPTARTSFVGREKEIEEVERLLSTTRLLTLSGAGGSGKTRLALEVARELVGSYLDGAWLVELASLAEGALVPQAVAEVMEVPEQPNRPLTDVLVDALSSRKLLLVLDNCEHLIDAASRLVDTLLDSCPHLRVLATSREALGVTGEVVRPVPPLAVPGTRHPLTVEELERYESARLFTERALQRWSGFALTSENAWNVAEICRRLDGIPLAIELAAARAGVLSVEQIARRLDDCFQLLSAGSRTALPRHRTLQATIGWSHGLLSEDERRLFRRLSVFAGGFTLGAAEAVCSGENLEEDEVLGLLAHLVDKSLLVVRERGGEMCYQLLETVRQYGWEKLEESGETEAARRAHANFFLTWAEEIGPKIELKIKTADRRPWLERLEIEHDNLRAALRWAVDTGEAKRGLRPAGALFWFWHMRGYLSEGRGWFERALAQVPARTAARAKALYYSGYLAWIQGDYPVARSQLQESVEIWRKLEGRRGALAHALWLLGLVMLAQGEITAARSLAEESVEMFRTIGGDDFGLSMSLAILGIVVVNQGDCTLATSLLEESAAVARKMGDDWFLSLPIRYLGAAAFRQGDYDRAAVLLKESLVLLWESGEKWYISRSIECLATVDAMRGDHVRAARLFGAGEAMREAIDASQVPFYLVDYDRGMAAAQTALGEKAFAAAWAEGKAMTREAAMEYAFSDEASSSTDPMPASPTRTAKLNLPVSRSSFVGRERELVEVKERLDEARLLTLTGAGGSGKTRLALRVAEELVGAYRDGVWLVELAPLSEGELVPQVVAGALKVREQQERPMIETLIQALREKEILLVLDNCEHLVDAAASLVDTLLGTCPGLKVLATSREALGVAGEANWPVPPLSLPETDSPLMAEGLAGYEATRLFVQRARYRDPAFEPTGQNARAVAEVCRRVVAHRVLFKQRRL